MACSWANGCCQRHPRVGPCAQETLRQSVRPATPEVRVRAAPAGEHPLAAAAAPSSFESTRLLLSVTVAASTPAWYVRVAAANWLRFTEDSTHVVMHLDKARALDFSPLTPPRWAGRPMANQTDARASPALHEWRWLSDAPASARVHLNPRRIATARRTGSLLVAHLSNFEFATRRRGGAEGRRLAAGGRRKGASAARFTHFVFTAVNCFFLRPGVEGYIAQRQASLAIRVCQLSALRPSKHHCTRERWFGALNGHRKVHGRSLVEGHFFPVQFLEEVARALASMDVEGRPLPSNGSHLVTPLLERLAQIPCTAEENVVPALAARSAVLERLANGSVPTEQIAWIPPTLAADSFVSLAAVQMLHASTHTPQQLCQRDSPCGVCPDKLAFPQTKFMVKRVPADASDASRVRRFIASLPGLRGAIDARPPRPGWLHTMLRRRAADSAAPLAPFLSEDPAMMAPSAPTWPGGKGSSAQTLSTQTPRGRSGAAAAASRVRLKPPVGSPCTWASGCCHRHPISCRDSSHLLLEPSSRCGGGTAGCCVGAPVYTRIGKTGSKNTTLFFARKAGTPCAQWQNFHDVLAATLPEHQNKVTVMREPCSRARSLLRHWHALFPSSHPVHRVKSLDDFATFLQAYWKDITTLPWPEADPERHHYIVGWPQSWYVDRCTRVLCFERLDSDLNEFCSSAARMSTSSVRSGQMVGRDSPKRTRKAMAGSDEAACARVRKIYAADTQLYHQHCS
ncbi:hypothetical protein AB1Y20_015606 [Prymnesium parvum]|uniref:Uncharacterized protein n=1 Tax=Prymnesium parvum TaxID=97485 RepID=A0AB34K1Z1_PRYPA